jgi:hypothetical protein
LENEFVINIVDTSLFTTISACATYTLPPITFGGYYTQPMGGGAQDPQQLQKMAAASAVQMAERKKQIQDDIKAKQQEIQDLQKELATLK